MSTALVFVDGFDKYGPTGNQNLTSVIAGEWSASGSTFAIVAPLSSNGYALQINNLTILAGNLPSSLTRVVGSVRVQANTLATQACVVQFRNSGTAAFSLVVNQSGGVIELRTGVGGGTLITSGGSISLNTTHVLSFDITIGASAAYTVYLDGVSLFTGTGNTGNSQSSVNQIALGTGNSGTVIGSYDDLCIFDPTNAAYNSSVLTSNVVVETQFPSADTQTQFTNDGNVVWTAGTAANAVFTTASSAITNAPGANELFLLKVTPQVACTINSVSTLPRATSSTANFKAVIYSDSTGSPGSLLSSGTQVTGTTSGTILTGALVTPQSLSAGTSYWLGFITDTSVVLQQVDTTTNLGQKKANTYTSGAPAGPLSGMTTGQTTWYIYGNCTGATTNWESVGMNPPLGTSAAQIHSSTVGQEDLYTFPALVTTPSAVYGCAIKGFISKSDSGARTVSFNMKSNTTDSTGSNASQGLSTTDQWQNSIFDTDPNTGSAWTNSGINNAKSGISVAS